MSADGRAYRSIARNVSPLRYLDDPEALVDEMRSILDLPGWYDPDTSTPGWEREIAQAGPQYVWEWLIMDRTAPWADLFTAEHRYKVGLAIAYTLKREV